MVSFEEVEVTLKRESGLPVALDLAEDKNWSVLHITAARPTWFRSNAVFAFFDDLADDVFFDEYDRVIFYGAEAGGYAAAAYSVTAPGARVVALAPQATMETRIAGWDTRFPSARRIAFGGRYAYAPEMIEAAEEVMVLFDPQQPMDAMHATLFRNANVTLIPMPYMADPEGGSLALVLERMDLLHPLIDGLGSGEMSRADAHKALRKRHGDLVWLRRLIVRLVAQDRQRLIALACKASLKRGGGPMFRKRLNAAIQAMDARGEYPDWLDD